MRTFKVAFIAMCACLGSCASRYSTINPEQLPYGAKSKESGVSLQYHYSPLTDKYATKERKKGLKLVALKILNNSEEDYIFGENLNIVYENGADVPYATTDQTYNELRQKPATHLLYLLLTPINLTVGSTTTNGSYIEDDTSFIPIGLVIGPGITLLNYLKANKANKQFKKELEDYDIFNKKIPSGETVYGILGIKSKDYKSLDIKID